MFRRQFALTIACLLFFGLVAAACAPTAPAPAPTAPPTGPTTAPAPKEVSGTVKFYKGPFGPNEADQQNGFIAQFTKANPKIQMSFAMFDWPTQEQQITSAVAGGTYNMIYVPEGMYPKFCYKGGPLTDMGPYVNNPSFKAQKDNTNYWDAATAPDGTLCGVPSVWIPESHWVVNLDMIKAAGCPDNWNASLDSVRDCAVKMTKPGVYGFAIRTGGLAQFSQHDFYGYMLRSGANFLTPDFKGCGLKTPELATTFQWLVDMQNKYKTGPDFGAYTWDGLRGLFAAGKIGIMHDEPTIEGVLQSKPPTFKYTFMGIPGLKNNHLITFRGFFVIPAAAKDKDAAWEAIKYFTTPQVEVAYLNGTSGLFPTVKDTQGLTFSPNDALLQTFPQAVAKDAEGPQFHQQMVEFQNNMQPLLDQMLQGQLTVQQTIDQSCQMIESKLKK